MQACDVDTFNIKRISSGTWAGACNARCAVSIMILEYRMFAVGLLVYCSGCFSFTLWLWWCNVPTGHCMGRGDRWCKGPEVILFIEVDSCLG